VEASPAHAYNAENRSRFLFPSETLVHPIRLAVRALGAAALIALAATTLPSLAAGDAAPALDPANLDPTCKACDDFYQYATGGWQKTHAIPAGHPSWGSFDELVQRNREALHAILEAAAKTAAAPAGSDVQKLGSFYRACMDEAGIERAGTAPIDPLLASVGAVGDVPSLVDEIARLQTQGVSDGLYFSSEADSKDSSLTVATIGLGGLGLPDRDYYLKDDERTAKIRSAYHEYVAAQLQNLGDDPAAAAEEADAVTALETALAKATPTRVELRVPNATYHPTALAALPAIGPHIPWPSFFSQFGAPAFSTVDVSVPAFVTAYDAQLTATRCRPGRRFCASTWSTRTPSRCPSASSTRRSLSAAGCSTG
jgi:predicted metalloendopeptidase